MLVFEEVITYGAEAKKKTQSSQYCMAASHTLIAEEASWLNVSFVLREAISALQQS